jgi:hypothetical protein
MDFFKIKRYLTLFLSVYILIACTGDDSNSGVPEDSVFDGELVWVKTFGGTNEDDAIDIVEADDGGYVVLGFTNSTDGDITGKINPDQDYWLLKLNQGGDKIWDKTYGGSQNDQATSLSKTNDGGYIISGYTSSFDGDVSENAGFQDYWIVKVDSQGEIQWEKSFGFVGQDQAYKVIPTTDGGYFVSGTLQVGEGGSNGEGNDVTNNNQNSRNSQHSLGDYWGIKMDADGNKIWRRYFGGTQADLNKDVIETDDGGFLLIGVSDSPDFDISNAIGADDFWVIKLSATGEKVWEQSYGGFETDRAFSIARADDGNYLLSGESRSLGGDVSNPKGGGDIWIVKINASNGSILWEKSFGGAEFDTSRGVKNLGNGSFAIAGSSRSTGGDASNNYGANDAWLLIVNENGALEYETNIGGSDIDFGNNVTGTSNNEIVFVGSTLSNDFDIPLNKGDKDVLIFKMR